MLVTKKMLLALTLIGALVGAGIGALLTRTASTTSAADNSYNTAANTDRTQPVSYNTKTPEQIAAENGPQFNTTAEQTAYREGFDAGYAACGTESTNSRATTTRTSYALRADRLLELRRVALIMTTARRPRAAAFGKNTVTSSRSPLGPARVQALAL
jgi:hypothetical protein